MKSYKLASVIALVFLASGILAEEKCPSSAPSQKRSGNDLNTITDQDFGLSLGPDDFLSMMHPMMSMSPFGMFRDYFRPWRRLASLTKDVGSTIKTDKNQFTINLDVQHFAPEEITVKTADGFVTIEAKHEEKKDEHGYISRQFVRRYALPEGTEAESIQSQLSSDGVLTVTAPRKALEGPKERVIPITQTGPVRKETAVEQGQCESEACVSEE